MQDGEEDMGTGALSPGGGTVEVVAVVVVLAENV